MSVAASCRSEAQTCTLNEESQAAERKAKNLPKLPSHEVIQNCFNMISRAKQIDGIVQRRRAAEMKKSTEAMEKAIRDFEADYRTLVKALIFKTLHLPHELIIGKQLRVKG